MKNEIELIKEKYHKAFGRLNADEESTLEFYYKMGKIRGVNSFLYVNEAIERTSMKQDLKKPICYIAGLLKSFYKNGLYSQLSGEENDLIYYVESKIGNLNDRNKNLLKKVISTVGTTKLMAAAAETLNNSKIQDTIIDEILLELVSIWNLKSECIIDKPK